MKVPIRAAGFFVGDPDPEHPALHEQFDVVMQYLGNHGVETKLYDVSVYLKKLYNAKKSKKFGSRGAELLARGVMWADIIIIASPVHWFGPSLLGHAFIHHVLAPLEWGGTQGGGYEAEGKIIGTMFTYHELGAAMAASYVHFVTNHMKMHSPGWSAHCWCPELKSSEDGWQGKPQLMAQVLLENARRLRNLPSAVELEREIEKDE